MTTPHPTVHGFLRIIEGKPRGYAEQRQSPEDLALMTVDEHFQRMSAHIAPAEQVASPPDQESHIPAQTIAEAAVEQLIKSGAEHYQEFQFDIHIAGRAGARPVVVTVAFSDGPSAHELRLKAEQERDTVLAALAELGKQEPVAWIRSDTLSALEISRAEEFPAGGMTLAICYADNTIPLYAAPAAAQAGQVSQAWLDVQAERRRQVESKGFDAGHDDMATRGQIARAASCYALHAGGIGTAWPDGIRNGSALFWPWDKEWWKPKSARENLVRAGALILAEIERIDRTKEGGAA